MPRTFEKLKQETLLGARLLIVDDDEALRGLIVSLLQRWGSRATGVGSAEAAAEILAAEHFDALVLDLHLPGVSGNVLLRDLRSQSAHELLPVLMVTGDPATASRRLAYASGVDSYMVKPFDNETLLLSLCGLLNKQRVVATLEPSINVLMGLGHTLELKDSYTLGHSDRVSLYSRNMGEAMGLDKAQLQTLTQGGLLHDLGKIGIPEGLLSKAGQLTTDERRAVETHPVLGEALVGNFTTMKHTLPIVRHHHERCDGSGYPDGLRGQDIPLLARITSYADVYDALTSRRPYREPFSHARAMEIILRDAQRGLLDLNLYGFFEQVANRNDERAVQV